ncbi:formyltetrahydrofolate deformylase [Brachybacterium sp. AOP25-B2-12]|uniref:formyltetrahydrofolate deformylase n=1 Tax=Brachybacterium sp. AOP25-B2-12 TaxID=3457710 RepID=UPI0040333F23
MTSAFTTEPAAQGTSGTAHEQYVLTLVCTDRPGIVHAITGAVIAVDGNIDESQQFTSTATGSFHMRLQVSTSASLTDLESALAPVISRYGVTHTLDVAGRHRRTLLLASTAPHCVRDLLVQRDSGDLPIDVPLILANHPDLARLAAFHDVPFEALPTRGAAEKAAFEERVLEAVQEHDVELVVLARYMQILSPELCAELSGRCINIHHSFLPGFKGANPYRQAYERGVKLIGATAHFVTSDLDEGPIIEQSVARVDHTRSPAELMALGRDEEVRALRRAVGWFAQSRVRLDGQRTVVFR